ncbi:bacteriocin, partial [Clostridium botulinum]|nr:bacteriocin [Clostridium botulinum]NFI04334.1 bacteriocin [Clostridium botulinum]
NKNQEVIGDLAEKFDVVETIETDVKEIKIKLVVKEGM